ncbi:MAG: Fur family transcriptional regulator [Fervidobacterium sp.]
MKGSNLDFNKYLEAKGLKLTKEREKILRQIISSNKHFEAEEFLFHLNKKRFNVSRPTFYRTLKVFTKLGILAKSNLEDGRVIYENLLSTNHHDHFVCTICGRIIEFKDSEIEKKQEKICEKYNFLGLRHQMQIFGLCKKCQGKERI